jgi:hypothetical protein
LARGDYDLWLKKENHRIRIRIAAGQQRDGYVLAESRQLEVRGEHPLQIAAVETADDAVTIRLQNSTKFARVHVFATRYDPAYAKARFAAPAEAAPAPTLKLADASSAAVDAPAKPEGKTPQLKEQKKMLGALRQSERRLYVKVYAQMQDGTVKFHKDGYTDLRGRFDDTSLSTNELDFVKKFSLLVLSDEHGAVVREASPPQR